MLQLSNHSHVAKSNYQNSQPYQKSYCPCVAFANVIFKSGSFIDLPANRTLTTPAPSHEDRKTQLSTREGLLPRMDPPDSPLHCHLISAIPSFLPSFPPLKTTHAHVVVVHLSLFSRWAGGLSSASLHASYCGGGGRSPLSLSLGVREEGGSYPSME